VCNILLRFCKERREQKNTGNRRQRVAKELRKVLDEGMREHKPIRFM